MAQASAEKLEHTGPTEKERVASVPQREQFGKNAGAAFAKRKRNRAVCPEYQIMRGMRESRWAKATPWQERGGSEQEHGVGRVDSIVREAGFKEEREGKQEEPP